MRESYEWERLHGASRYSESSANRSATSVTTMGPIKKQLSDTDEALAAIAGEACPKEK